MPAKRNEWVLLIEPSTRKDAFMVDDLHFRITLRKRNSLMPMDIERKIVVNVPGLDEIVEGSSSKKFDGYISASFDKLRRRFRILNYYPISRPEYSPDWKQTGKLDSEIGQKLLGKGIASKIESRILNWVRKNYKFARIGTRRGILELVFAPNEVSKKRGTQYSKQGRNPYKIESVKKALRKIQAYRKRKRAEFRRK